MGGPDRFSADGWSTVTEERAAPQGRAERTI